ncbi:hypothetical protein [Flammeovirga sp. EKP202]|uniref:hypothetical protein n=1 Tax=Flammeovirga sp. EKP202 TaxID=2770592 RepID=UPI00165FE5D7|nr:hypothetical protein [Flammeovirga sp. EKP202]MBD0400109.1 hypothetical protein [Flammeovirga sp. EKP202]
MKNTKQFSRSLLFMLLLTISSLLVSCGYNDDYYGERPPRPNTPLPDGCHWEWDHDDHHWERECDGRYSGGRYDRNNPPSERLPIGCHWEWDHDDQHWERDCD